MTQDHNKKSLRQFQCRDYLWEIFEQMGAELECSTDYLVNEAMRQYARSRNWGARSNGGVAVPQLPPRSPSVPAPSPRAAGFAPGVAAALAAPRAPSFVAGAAGAAGPEVSASAGGLGYAGRAGGSLPPPLPGGSAHQSGSLRTATMPSLFVIFNGQKLPVNKEEFVIGRGSKTADLPIKDGNISRRHAAIVLQNGAFYMKDLGSTNGIEFNGERVESRRIEEGDVYQLCDYELRFTYH